MQFSDKLKLARQQQQLTQTQIAEQLHVSQKQFPAGKMRAVFLTSAHSSGLAIFMIFLWINYYGRIRR